ncbi:MAG: hypothetical protein C3F10_10330 [Dehalococcoidia bacterium]|nr:MAG: hypothetical protein C3F10_10330 [Dehalococcoidia bacterium]
MIPVLISEAALRDIEDIWAFVSFESPESATALIRLLLERAFSLTEGLRTDLGHLLRDCSVSC